jgi:hypothetical protein
MLASPLLIDVEEHSVSPVVLVYPTSRLPSPVCTMLAAPSMDVEYPLSLLLDPLLTTTVVHLLATAL